MNVNDVGIHGFQEPTVNLQYVQSVKAHIGTNQNIGGNNETGNK